MTVADDTPEPSDADAPLVLDCPRCGSQVQQPFYGPCALCCDELRTVLRREASSVETVEYEPKVNVTPNAVALRDD